MWTLLVFIQETQFSRLLVERVYRERPSTSNMADALTYRSNGAPLSPTVRPLCPWLRRLLRAWRHVLCGLDPYVTVSTSDVQRAKLISQKQRKRRSNSTFQRWNLSSACLVACLTVLSVLEGKYGVNYPFFFFISAAEMKIKCCVCCDVWWESTLGVVFLVWKLTTVSHHMFTF